MPGNYIDEDYNMFVRIIMVPPKKRGEAAQVESQLFHSSTVPPYIQDTLHHITIEGRLVNRKIVLEREDGGTVTWMKSYDNPA
jgi:hypothetical protein